MAANNLHERLLARLMLPETQRLSEKELQDLFIDVGNKFTDNLDKCDEVEELREVHNYMRSITDEIRKKQKKGRIPDR